MRTRPASVAPWTHRGGRTWLALLAMLAASASAQDSTGVATLTPPADTTALVAPSVAAVGPTLSPVPALTNALDEGWLLQRVSTHEAAARLSVWTYGLGAPGHLAGLALDGLAPSRTGAVLDGRPLDDLFTGAARTDLIPREVTDRLRLGTEAGAPVVLTTSLRPFREGAPVTELRFHSGGLGLQHVSGTHAQTHRAPWGLGGRRSRMTVTFHVGSRQSDGAISGARLRHVHALGRVSVAAPRWAAEVTHHYTDQSAGARRGVLDNGSFFDPFRATVLDPAAERSTVRNELSASVRTRVIGPEPASLWASWTRQLSRYTPGTDTVSAVGNRFAVGVTQRLGSGPALRAWAAAEDDPWGRLDPLGDDNERLRVHAALADTLRLGGARVIASAGGHLADGRLGPEVSVRTEAGRLFGGASWMGVVPGRIERSGYASTIGPGVRVTPGDAPAEQVLSAEIGGRAEAGAFAVAARPFARVIWDAHRLLEQADVEATGADTAAFGFAHASAAIAQVGAQASVGWREGIVNGLYASSSATLQTWPSRDAGGLADRITEAVPTVFGSARLGFRAERVGTGSAALDLGATVRAWTAHRGGRVHPATGLVALARTDAPRLPARAGLDVDATVRFGTRARVFVTWENLLSGLVYDGARTVQGEPLPARHLRFGVFWAFSG
ncbi:MAG: hypothetical protein AAF791_05000 [Bacteroidota bacterium]